MIQITINEINEQLLQTGRNIKILDGIAGSAKTSSTVYMLQKAGIPYCHITSTNRLKKDIERRFSHIAYTAAGGMFTTTNEGGFYNMERDIPEQVIIIDEILQTSPRVYDWINDHPEKRFIICTDCKQMTTPQMGQRMIRDLRRLDADYYTLNYSYRPVNDATREKYNEAYAANSDGINLFGRLLQCTNEQYINDVQYSPHDVYICHSNACEKMLYDMYDLRRAYGEDLIPKGSIASKNPGRKETYPILPQADVSDKSTSRGYWQLSNIGSVLRYQGSEVQQGQRLYYIVEPGSRPSNREIYTMLTRAKDIADITIVWAKPQTDINITSFLGKPIYKDSLLFLDKGSEDYNKEEYTERELYTIKQKAQQSATVHYTGIMKDGKIIKPSDANESPRGRRKPSLYALMRKAPELALQYPNRMLKQIEKTGLEPLTFQSMTCKVNDEWKDDYKYMLDIRASYPTCWKMGGVPDGRTYRADKSGECNIYIITGGLFLEPGAIITEPLYKYISENTDAIFFSAECIGSVNYLKSDAVGNYLYEMTHTTREAKENVHGIHYGWLRRKYIDKANENGYFIDKNNVYELTFSAINSTQALIIAMSQMRIYGRLIYAGFCVADALFFNTEEKIITLGDDLHKIIPDYDFRIYKRNGKQWNPKSSENDIAYKTYEELPSANEIRKKQHAEKEKERRERYKKAGVKN